MCVCVCVCIGAGVHKWLEMFSPKGKEGAEREEGSRNTMSPDWRLLWEAGGRFAGEFYAFICWHIMWCHAHTVHGNKNNKSCTMTPDIQPCEQRERKAWRWDRWRVVSMSFLLQDSSVCESARARPCCVTHLLCRRQWRQQQSSSSSRRQAVAHRCGGKAVMNGDEAELWRCWIRIHRQ